MTKNNIITIVGKSNSGKTTLIEKLVKNLTKKGYKVGTAKHVHDSIEIDTKKKDSWRHKKAGANSVLIVSENKIALIKDDSNPHVNKMQSYLSDTDIVIAEGFKGQNLPKIEVFRKKACHKEPLYKNFKKKDFNLIAFVSDSNHGPFYVPNFKLEDIEKITYLIEDKFLQPYEK